MTGRTHVVVVLGMHRSGTSVGMKVLAELGIACGRDLVPAGRSNPAGFWEHAKIVAIQEQLLARLDRVWHGTRGTYPLPDGWLESDAAARAKVQLTKIVVDETAAHRGQIWGFKDPRTMRFLPLWEEIWRQLGIDPFPVVMFRHPNAVASSLARHNGLSPTRAALIWTQCNIEALRHTARRNRLIVEFDALVNDPANEVVRIAQALKDLVPTDATMMKSAVDAVSSDLRTHRNDDRIPSNTLVARTLSALRAASHGSVDNDEVANLLEDYDAAESLFTTWAIGRKGILSDWLVRFLVSRKNG